VVSAVEYARHARDYVLLPNLAISCDGPCGAWRSSATGRSGSWMIAPCCSQPPHGRRSACWSSCVATSGRCGLTSPRLGGAPDLDALAHLPHDAVLVIGDAALLLAAQHAYPHRYDLGEEWKRWTGLPFVFAVWAARRAADHAAVRAVHHTLLAARDWGLAHLDLLADAAARATGVDISDCRSYLAGLDYALTETHLAGSPTSSAGWPRAAWCPTDRSSSCRWPDHGRPQRQRVPVVPRAVRTGIAPRPGQPRPPGALAAASENAVTYIIDRNINYTNVCVADCKFCAFYRRPKHDEGYVLSFEQIGRKIDELKALGGVQILIQAATTPTSRSRGTWI